MLSFPKQEDNRNGIDHYDSNIVHAWNALNKQIFFRTKFLGHKREDGKFKTSNDNNCYFTQGIRTFGMQIVLVL